VTQSFRRSPFQSGNVVERIQSCDVVELMAGFPPQLKIVGIHFQGETVTMERTILSGSVVGPRRQ
jgi:hypothetical protein